MRSAGNAPVVLQIETDHVMVPAEQRFGSDTRVLGLRLDSIEWR